MKPVDVRSQADVEERILMMSDELSEQVELFAELSAQRADAEADYKYKFARALIDQPTKATVATRDAVATMRSADEFRAFRLLEARERATQAHMTALRTQLEALRTVAANVRHLTR